MLIERLLMSAKNKRIEARFSADIKALAERAAMISGYSLTDYLASLVINDAPKRIKAQNEITLSNQQFDLFVAACENASKPSGKILDAAHKLDEEGF
jgi:uncharacterized protein (DUF1778 family)